LARKWLPELMNREPSAAASPRHRTRNPGSQRAWIPAIVAAAVARWHRGWHRRWLPGWVTRWHRGWMPPSIAYTGAGAGTGAGTGILPLPPHASVNKTESGRSEGLPRNLTPKEFSPFPVARWGVRLEHLREAMGPPSPVIALRGGHELGSVGRGDTAMSMSSLSSTGRPAAGAPITLSDPAKRLAIVTPVRRARGTAGGTAAATARIRRRSRGPLDTCSTGLGRPGRCVELAAPARSLELRNVFRANGQRAGADRPSARWSLSASPC